MRILTKIKNSTIKFATKVSTAIMAAAISFNNFMLPVYASGGEGGSTGTTVNTDIDSDNLIGGIIDQILKIFQWIGILLLVWGIGQLVMAFKNEDADSKSRAMMMIVSSVLLIGLRTLLVAIGIIN